MPIDEELLARLAAGDEAAIAATYRDYRGAIYTLAYRICQCEQEALDVLQDTFVQAFTRIHQFRGESLWGWLRQIAVNQALSRLRKLRRVPLRLLTDADGAPARDAGHGVRLDLAAAFARLPADTRAVVWLYDVEGYSHQEIGALFGRSVSFSKTQVSRAHRKMRAWLDDSESEAKCQSIATPG